MSEDEGLDQDFAPDERIFHYTSAEGLYGILRSGCLWATHFQFLNDSREFYAARESLINFVKGEVHKQLAAWKVNGEFDFESGVDLRAIAEHEVTVIVDSMYETTYGRLGDPFVFSGFCCTPDHPSYEGGGLLHWATYGQRGGYALRLNPHKIFRLLKQEHKKFPSSSYQSGKVVYSTGVPPKSLSEKYEVIAKVARCMIEGLVRNDMSRVNVFESASPFWRISSMLKDAYFRDEEEARVVFMRMRDLIPDTAGQPIEMRHSDGVSVPYIEMFKGALLGDDCPIEAILIGPHAERARRLRALTTYLHSVSLSSIEVIESDVPYVG